MERLVREVGQAVAQRILGNNESVDDVARELHERLLLRNESTKKVVIESIYRESEEGTHNVNVFTNAPSLAEARPHLKKVRLIGSFGHNFLFTTFTGPYTKVYGQIPSSSQFWIAILYTCVLDLFPRITQLIVIPVYSPSIPPRSPERKTVFGSSSSFSSGMPPTPTNSPPRKVVTDFAAFGAPSTNSVFGTAVKSSPFSLAGSNSAFAAIRGGRAGMDDDDDDEDEDTPSVPGRQKIELREGSITFEQVCGFLGFSGLVSQLFTGTQNYPAERLAQCTRVMSTVLPLPKSVCCSPTLCPLVVPIRDLILLCMLGKIPSLLYHHLRRKHCIICIIKSNAIYSNTRCDAFNRRDGLNFPYPSVFSFSCDPFCGDSPQDSHFVPSFLGPPTLS